MIMKLNPQPTLLMADVRSGHPPPDAQNWNPRRPRIRRVTADHHPLELQDGDPDLDDLLKLVGKDAMAEFGQFVEGGFRMVELLGLIDDPVDQLSAHIVDDLKPHVPVLPMATTRTKLIANAVVAVTLRGLGATIYGPFEESVFLHPTASTNSKVLAWKLLGIPGVQEVLSGDLWWSEVPPVTFDINDPDDHWEDCIPNPEFVIELLTRSY